MNWEETEKASQDRICPAGENGSDGAGSLQRDRMQLSYSVMCMSVYHNHSTM
ncbi:MAG: hypothetical protein IJ860_01775 [Eubacterium sp.]|nr:hypothetical protein [Eubacterium sp.]